MTDLKECPFCGSTDIDAKGWMGANNKTGPECMGCTATAESVDKWNTRPNQWNNNMDEAPKDGTLILVKNDKATEVCFWLSSFWQGTYYDGYSFDYENGNPTAWKHIEVCDE